VEDGIDCLMRIIENKEGCASGGIFNIGNPVNDLSVRELAEKLISLVMEYPAYRAKADACRIVETTSDTYYGKGYQDMLNRVPSIRNAGERLGWAPKTGIDEALRRTLNFYLIEQKEKIEHLL
jgi:nucleoside-diphosphate-sugar epimerase